MKLEELRLETSFGKFIWTIHGFKSLQEKEDYVYSPPFYSWRGGYKLCMETTPKGFGDGKGTHLSVGAALIPGEYDDILPWPFTKKVQLTLFSQQQDKKGNLVQVADNF